MKIRGFAHALQALRPRLDEIVVTGGWAWYLYRKYFTGERALPGEFTLDVDVVLPRGLSQGSVSLGEMLAGADFEGEMGGEEDPPVTKYLWPSTEEPEAIVEFLAPARGSGEEATLEIGGVVAQQLRFLDLLLREPLTVEIDERAGGEEFVGRIRVPRIGLFVLQKALTFRRRHETRKRDKDLFYVFDLADDSRGLVERIEEDIRSLETQPEMGWMAQAATILSEECGFPEADAIGRVISQIPREQRPSRKYVSDTFLELVRTLRGNAG